LRRIGPQCLLSSSLTDHEMGGVAVLPTFFFGQLGLYGRDCIDIFLAATDLDHRVDFANLEIRAPCFQCEGPPGFRFKKISARCCLLRAAAADFPTLLFFYFAVVPWRRPWRTTASSIRLERELSLLPLGAPFIASLTSLTDHSHRASVKLRRSARSLLPSSYLSVGPRNRSNLCDCRPPPFVFYIAPSVYWLYSVSPDLMSPSRFRRFSSPPFTFHRNGHTP